MYVWLRTIGTLLPLRFVAFSHHSVFTRNYSLGWGNTRQMLMRETRRLSTDTFARSKNDARTRGKNEWDVETLAEEDRFGRLNNQGRYELKTFEEVYEVTEEDKDQTSDVERVYRGRKNTPIWYGNQMKKLLKGGKLKDALDVLEVRMLKEDHVQPTEYNYDVLIGGCGRAGYTKKAFKLFNDMKKRGLQPSGVTYTALFNACAESPWQETDGLTRLTKLHEQLQEKECKINLATHHAMMKAYAKCGDVQTAFKLFHHLLESNVQLNVDSFVFLLFACASQKESGFVFAIEGWRHMLLKGIQPNITTYNLLLRIVRDCGIGDVETANRVLLNSPTLNQKMIPAGSSVKQKRAMELKKRKKHQEVNQLEVSKITDDRTASEDFTLFSQNNLQNDARMARGSDKKASEKEDLLVRTREQLMRDAGSLQHTGTGSLNGMAPVSGRRTSKHPNMLSLNPDLEGIMSLTGMAKPDDRLSLLGGIKGLVESMTSNEVKPDCKTLTLLAEIIPRRKVVEAKLLKVVDDLEVKVDVDFYNMLIRKRTRRLNLEAAKDLLTDIKHKGLYPNIRTYVTLASGCTQQQDGLQLLTDVRAAGMTPTQPLYNALISAAHTQDDYNYVVNILKDMQENEVWPDQRTIKQLEKIANFGARQQKANPNLNGFRGFYTLWLDRIGYQKGAHPWSAYQNTD